LTGDKNIILTGFMGTGKTTIGKEIARLLDRTFLDTDGIIEEEQKRTVSDIFQKEGESYFRNLERQVIDDICNRSRTVIATGGGTLLDENNLTLLSKTGIIFCLTTSIDVLVSRLENSMVRPLAVNKEMTDIEKLYEIRKDYYDKLPYHFDTSDISPENAACKIIELFNEITSRTGIAK